MNKGAKMARLLYDDIDFAKIKTTKQLARFILNILEYDNEVPYGELLDCIEQVCTYVKKNKTIKRGK